MKKTKWMMCLVIFAGILLFAGSVDAQADEVKVIFHSGTPMDASAKVFTVERGTEITLPDTYWSMSNWMFDGWDRGINLSTLNETTQPDYKKGDRVVASYDENHFSGRWKQEIYTIKLNANGGKFQTSAGKTKTASFTKYCNTNAYIGQYGLQRPGYTFLGWSNKNNSKKILYKNYYNKNSNATLYAVWQFHYKVTFKKGKKRDKIVIQWRRGEGASLSRVYVSRNKNFAKTKKYRKNTYRLVTKSKKKIITVTFDVEKRIKGYRYIVVENESKVGKTTSTTLNFSTKVKCR